MKIRVFVSYSHQDAGYLERDSLLGYLMGLEDDGVDFWWDKALVAGDDWDAEIKARISETHIALVLVSQMFLDSQYCKSIEISGFLRQCRESGLVIIPIILSACEWQRHEWLKNTQFLPTGGETIEENYTDLGKKKRLFFDIRQDLRAQVERMRQSALRPIDDTGAISEKRPLVSQFQPHEHELAEDLDNITHPAVSVAAPAVANSSETAVSSGDKTGIDSAEDKLRTGIPEWVDRVLTVRVPETGGFDSSLFEPTGSPSLWSTAQCLTGILGTPSQANDRDEVARVAFNYIKKMQRDDGGWAYSDTQNETVTEVSCWVTLAYAKSVEAGIWKSDDDGQALATAIERALKHILSRKSSDGGWCPTDQVVPRNTRTYTTAMAVWSLFAAKNTPTLKIGNSLDRDIMAAIRWLLDGRRDDLGWVPNPNRRHQKDRHPGLNAQVLFILTQFESAFPFLKNVPVYKDAKRDFLTDGAWWKYDFFENTSIRDADQWLEGTDFRIEGSTFLWCPWSLAALQSLSIDPELLDEQRKRAAQLRAEMMEKIEKCRDDIGTSGTWELAETLFCVAYALR